MSNSNQNPLTTAYLDNIRIARIESYLEMAVMALRNTIHETSMASEPEFYAKLTETRDAIEEMRRANSTRSFHNQNVLAPAIHGK